ncbi:hypothetical protein L2E82_44554 [Cichorium intybus]|uniref:Uncharacterized protein n=1 Tax=Cichorium intybus TaxID=13427 RepID=A0ACB8ZPN8_CICIN|nr:hypothetical protein L2E82_44554 [Cichorium intybus]
MLRRVLNFDGKLYTIEERILRDYPTRSTNAEIDDHLSLMNDLNKVAHLMLDTIIPELQRSLWNLDAFDIIILLKDMFQKPVKRERFKVMKSLLGCRLQKE